MMDLMMAERDVPKVRPVPFRGTKSPSEMDRHVSERIRQQRLLIGMSQEKLAEVLGVTFQQIQKYEKGTNRIGAGRLLTIARTLGVPVAYFFEGHSESEVGDDPALDLKALLSTREGVMLAQTFARIEDASVRQALVALARAAARVDD